MTELRKVTLTVITYDDKILLGLKKRGFGEGHWNGFGGKPEPGESLLDCVVRETREECGITINNLELAAILDFHFQEKPDWDQQVHVFKTSEFEGTPRETEEMRPKEFAIKEIPYESMWPDDKFWLPLVLDGKKVRATFTFADDGSVAEKVVDVVDQLF